MGEEGVKEAGGGERGWGSWWARKGVGKLAGEKGAGEVGGGERGMGSLWGRGSCLGGI